MVCAHRAKPQNSLLTTCDSKPWFDTQIVNQTNPNLCHLIFTLALVWCRFLCILAVYAVYLVYVEPTYFNVRVTRESGKQVAEKRRFNQKPLMKEKEKKSRPAKTVTWWRKFVWCQWFFGVDNSVCVCVWYDQWMKMYGIWLWSLITIISNFIIIAPEHNHIVQTRLLKTLNESLKSHVFHCIWALAKAMEVFMQINVDGIQCRNNLVVGAFVCSFVD